MNPFCQRLLARTEAPPSTPDEPLLVMLSLAESMLAKLALTPALHPNEQALLASASKSVSKAIRFHRRR